MRTVGGARPSGLQRGLLGHWRCSSELRSCKSVIPNGRLGPATDERRTGLTRAHRDDVGVLADAVQAESDEMVATTACVDGVALHFAKCPTYVTLKVMIANVG